LVLMATRAHLVVDGRGEGLPSAPGYYRVFPKEPSPLGDLSFAPATTTVMAGNTSLDAALTAMMRAGSGGAVVLVCHAFKGGLLLPIAPNGGAVFAVVDNLKIVDLVVGAESEVDAIRKAARTTDDEKKAVLDRWKKLINRLQPNSITGAFTEREAEKFYAKFVDMVARKLGFNGPAPLRQFLARLLAVRRLRLSRVELRACTIGADKNTMEFIRTFLNIEHLTAPTVETFYHSPIPVDTMWAADKFGIGRSRNVPRGFRVPGSIGQTRPVIEQGNDPRHGPGWIDVYTSVSIRGGTGHTTRGFLQNWAFHTTFWLGFYEFILTVDETSLFHYRATAAVTSAGNGVTPDWTKVRSFVKTSIMDSTSYVSGPFPIAGFWTPDSQNQPFVLPNEPNYTKLIGQVPASKNK
jgi:hypothetical protein